MHLTLKIEKLQRRACKLILWNYHTTLDAARKQWRILSFEETVFIHKAKVMYKIANNAAPIYLTELFQMRGNDSYLNNSHLNLRSTSNKNFLIPKPKISLFKNSLSYSGALVWNSIPLWIKRILVQLSPLWFVWMFSVMLQCSWVLWKLFFLSFSWWNVTIRLSRRASQV